MNTATYRIVLDGQVVVTSSDALYILAELETLNEQYPWRNYKIVIDQPKGENDE